MSIQSILCCCSVGVGSSYIVRTNVEEALCALNIEGVRVSHAAVDDFDPHEADLFVFAGDLRGIDTGVDPERIVWISNILDKDEIREKLAQIFK